MVKQLDHNYLDWCDKISNARTATEQAIWPTQRYRETSQGKKIKHLPMDFYFLLPFFYDHGIQVLLAEITGRKCQTKLRHTTFM